MATGNVSPPAEDLEFEDLDWDNLSLDEDEPESPAEADEGPADAQADESEGAGEGDEAQPAAEAEDGATPEGAAPETATPEAKEPEPERLPFGFRADGKQVEVPGAETYVYPDGRRVHVIPDDSFNRVMRHHLADRNAFRQREMEREQRIAELTAAADPQNNATVQAANKAMQFIEALLAEPLETDAEAAERVLVEFAKWKAQYPVWKATQERDAEKTRADQILAARDNVRLEPDEYEREQQQVVVDQTLSAGMAEFLNHALTTSEAFKGLPQNELDDVVAEAWENRLRYVHQADKDYPDMGLKKGDAFFDFRPLLAPLERAANRARRYHEQIEGVKKQYEPRISEVAQVARENAATLTRKKPAATASRPTGERPSGKDKPKANDWESFREAFENADLLSELD